MQNDNENLFVNALKAQIAANKELAYAAQQQFEANKDNALWENVAQQIDAASDALEVALQRAQDAASISFFARVWQKCAAVTLWALR